jgi:hypothetical protein
MKTHKNKITFNCSNFKKYTKARPKNCYVCAFRDGYPQNLGGDKNCENFKQVKAKINNG